MGRLGEVNEIVAGTRGEVYENTLFTPDGQAQIPAQLREIKESLRKAHSLSGEQLAAIEGKT